MSKHPSDGSESPGSAPSHAEAAAALRMTIREVLFGQGGLSGALLEAVADEALRAEGAGRLADVDGLMRVALDDVGTASLRQRSRELVDRVLADRHRAERLHAFLAIAEDNFRRWSIGETIRVESTHDAHAAGETEIVVADDTRAAAGSASGAAPPTAAGVRRVAALDPTGYQTYLLVRFAGLTVSEVAQLQGKLVRDVEDELRLVEHEATIG